MGMGMGMEVSREKRSGRGNRKMKTTNPMGGAGGL